MKSVNLQQLKSWAREKLAKSDTFRVAIVSQPDKVTFEDFLVLFKGWERILAARRLKLVPLPFPYSRIPIKSCTTMMALASLAFPTIRRVMASA